MNIDIHNSFHEIGNLLNRINASAGYGKDCLKRKENLTKEELIDLLEGQEILYKKIEDNVMKVDKIITEIKPTIYKAIEG